MYVWGKEGPAWEIVSWKWRKVEEWVVLCVVLGEKVGLCIVGFQFFGKKSFTNFRKGDTMGQKVNF